VPIAPSTCARSSLTERSPKSALPATTDRAALGYTRSMTEHEERAEELEREADDMQERVERLEDETDEAGEDWERKKGDPGVPGAVGDSDED
jgi:predicted  nucleic acid-binding Zn-ribbon protein